MRTGLVVALAVSFLLLFAASPFAANRVYFQETKDTLYIYKFPGKVDLHMMFDNDDTLTAMVHPFSWAGSSDSITLVAKNCDNSGWFAGSGAAIFDQKICRFDPPDKQMVNGLRFTCQTCVVPPGANRLYAVWTFNVQTENSILCMDSTFMTPTNHLRWINIKSAGITPQYTKRCWVIAKSPAVCGDANSDGKVDLVDIVYLINYVFYGGPPPGGSADVDGDGVVDISDIIWLINYMFYGGPPPTC